MWLCHKKKKRQLNDRRLTYLPRMFICTHCLQRAVYRKKVELEWYESAILTHYITHSLTDSSVVIDLNINSYWMTGE